MKNRDVETGMTEWCNQQLTYRALASQLQRAEASHRPVPPASAAAPAQAREKGETEGIIRRRHIAEQDEESRRSPVKAADSPEERPGDNLFCERQIRIACISCRHWRLVTVNPNGISTGDVSFLIHQLTNTRSHAQAHTHAQYCVTLHLHPPLGDAAISSVHANYTPTSAISRTNLILSNTNTHTHTCTIRRGQALCVQLLLLFAAAMCRKCGDICLCQRLIRPDPPPPHYAPLLSPLLLYVCAKGGRNICEIWEFLIVDIHQEQWAALPFRALRA